MTHRKIKRFQIDVEFQDNAQLISLRPQYENLLIQDMRGIPSILAFQEEIDGIPTMGGEERGKGRGDKYSGRVRGERGDRERDTGRVSRVEWRGEERRGGE